MMLSRNKLGIVFVIIGLSLPLTAQAFLHPSSFNVNRVNSIKRASSSPSIIRVPPNQRANPARSSLSSSSSSSPSPNISNGALQRKLQIQTLSRITIPSIAAASICFATFPSITTALAISIHDAFDGANTGYGYETLNLILTDNSNQFIQNAHNALSLIFAFLTTNTLFFMYRQQETLYFALFDEITALVSLLEQSALLSEGRSEIYNIILANLERYVEEDLKLVTDYKTIQLQDGDSRSTKEVTIAAADNSMSPLSFVMEEMYLGREDLPALLLSRRPKDDPLEAILYATSVGEPSIIYSTVKSLRQARAKRLGALQRKMPEVNMYLLYALGFTVWISFPVVTAGAQTVGGDALLEVFRAQLSMGVFAMWGIFGIINELKRPEIASAYNVDYQVLGTLLDGVEKELEFRRDRISNLGGPTADGLDQDIPTIVSDYQGGKPWIGRRIVNKILRK